MNLTTHDQPVRLVGVKFLNARPLLAGLEAGIAAPFPYTLATAEPSACAEEVGRQRAAAGLIPVAALPDLPEVQALPGLGIACRREATSVLLVARVPPAKIKTLAAHSASRTSVALAHLLLKERWGARFRVVSGAPPLEQMLAGADAAVVVGDPALAIRGRSGLLEIDLAAAWVEWTSLPFVFAIWGVRPHAPDGVETLLGESLAYAETHWQDLVPRWAAAHGQSVEATDRYLGRTLVHRLREEERVGMEEFLGRATAAGVLPAWRSAWLV